METTSKKQIDGISSTVAVLIENSYKLKQIAKKIEDPDALHDIEDVIKNTDLEIKNIQDFIIQFKTENMSNIYKKIIKYNINIEFANPNSKIDKFTSEDTEKIIGAIVKKIDQEKSDADMKVKINTYNTDQNLVIEISMNKKSIDMENLIFEAIDTKIISKEESEKLDKSEIMKLLIENEKISDEKTIKNLIEKNNMEFISSESEEDYILKIVSSFSSTMDGLDVSVNKVDFIIPAQNIKESVDGKIAKIDSIGNSSESMLLSMRDEAIPVVDLAYEFGIREKISDVKDYNLLVAEHENKKIAFIIDTFGDKASIVAESTKNYGQIFGISDGTIRGDGKIVFIIKVEDFIKGAKRGRQKKKCTTYLY